MVVIKDNKEMPYDSNKIRRAIIQAANQIKLPDFDFIDSLTKTISFSTKNVIFAGIYFNNRFITWHCPILIQLEKVSLTTTYS